MVAASAASGAFIWIFPASIVSCSYERERVDVTRCSERFLIHSAHARSYEIIPLTLAATISLNVHNSRDVGITRSFGRAMIGYRGFEPKNKCHSGPAIHLLVQL